MKYLRYVGFEGYSNLKYAIKLRFQKDSAFLYRHSLRNIDTCEGINNSFGLINNKMYKDDELLEPSQGGGKKKQPEPGTVVNGASMGSVAGLFGLCWGDVGLFLGIAAGLGVTVLVERFGRPERRRWLAPAAAAKVEGP